MRLRRGGPIGWWSPHPRGIVPLDGVHVSRSLRRACRRFVTTVDAAFADVMLGCADPSRPSGWIDRSFVDAYSGLHEMGWAHSVEVWREHDGGRELVGGLYGVAIGALFAGESMFHRASDASKVALVATVERLRAGGGRVFDVQWCTPHLATLGAVELPRPDYLTLARDAVAAPQLTLT